MHLTHFICKSLGTRRISYILYMPLPSNQPWQPSWGGALELYPTVPNPETGIEEPLCAPSKIIPPSWNQFVFFEVQPGKSFHSVEEVVIDEGDEEDGEERQRLSISGWFHAAQEGEEGYDPNAKSEAKSSLEQLVRSFPFYLSTFLDKAYRHLQLLCSKNMIPTSPSWKCKT